MTELEPGRWTRPKPGERPSEAMNRLTQGGPDVYEGLPPELRKETMRTPIDHYIEDALDDIADPPVEFTIDSEGYEASRDVDARLDDGLTRDVAFRRRSFDPVAERVVPPTDGHVAVGVDGIEVDLVQGVHEDDFKRTCAEAISGPTGKAAADVNWDELLRGGLQTGLETQVIVFAVRGVSRACTHQLVRTRKAAFHQQSQRAVYYGPHPEVRVAESVWKNPRARAAALRAIYFSHKAYEVAVEEDISYQDARLNLMEGTTNFILCEYPLRTFIETYAYRGCSMFQWEIVTVFRKMRELLVEAHPWMEPHVKISCEKTSGAVDTKAPGGSLLMPDQAAHTCTYQGHENVDGQCDFPWARNGNRSFVPDDEHRIERKR